MAELSTLKDHFRTAADELENLLQRSHSLSGELQRQQSDMLRLTSAGAQVVASYKAMQTNAVAIGKEWVNHHNISVKLVKDYGEQAKAVNELKKQYAELERIQKILDLAAKSTSEKMQASFDTMGRVAGGAVGLAARLTTLGLSYEHLKNTLLDFNRSAFEGMRVGERYGDSTDKLARSLKIASSQTALSQKDFVDLNLTIKQLTVGLPMTSEAVVRFAATLTNKLGWSAEQVKKGMTDLLPLQNKLPSLFDRITKAQNDQSGSTVKAAASVKMLTDKLYAMGASREEVEKVLNVVTKPKFEFDKWMAFEKTIAKSKQTIQDVNLEIANKMQLGLEAVAKTQAQIAKLINVLPSGIMLAVAGFALMGVAVGKVLFQLSQVSSIMKMLPAYAAATGAGLDKGSLKSFGKTMASGAGAVAANAAPIAGAAFGDWASSRYLGTTEDYDPAKGAPKDGRWGAALSEGGANALGWGATGAYYGKKFAGKRGMLIGGGIGSIAGMIGGGISGYLKGGDANAEKQSKYADYQGDQVAAAGQMGMAARGAGVKVGEGASRKEILEAIKQETDLGKQKAAYEALYSMGAVKTAEVQDGILKNVKNEKTAREATVNIVTKILSGVNGIQDVERQIERSVEGQTQELEAQIQIYNKLAEVGKAAASSLEAGTLGTEMANMLMTQGMDAYQQQASAIGKQAVLAYVKAFSDNEGVMSKLNPMEKMSSQQIQEAEKQVQDQSMKIAKMKEDLAQKESGVKDSGQKAKVHEAGIAAIQQERDALAGLTEQMNKMEAGADFTKAFNMGDVNKGIEEINVKIKKLREEQAAGNKQTLDAKGGWQDIDTVLDGLLSKQGQMVDLAGKYAAIVAGPINQAFATATAGTKREIGMQDQLIGLGEARLALAEKMGMPQSYRALKDQVALTYQQYQNNEKVVKQQQDVVRQLEIQYKTSIDVQSVLNGTKTIEQVIGEAKEKSLGTAKMTGEAEIAAVAAIKNQVGATTQMVNLEGKLAELTKTWREGWLDAMEETVINAGDFTAIIGMGGKNVPEAIAAGRPDTFRYGGVNRQAMDAAQQRELQSGQAPRFTDAYGNISGDIQKANPLMKNSNVVSWNPAQGVGAAAAGMIPVLAPGQAGAAGMEAAAQDVANRSGSRTFIPANAGPLAPGEYGAAGNKTLGVQQPGGPHTGLPNPTMVSPTFTNLDSSANNLNTAAANLNNAADKFASVIPNLSAHGGATATKSNGGVVRAAGGGMLRLGGGGTATPKISDAVRRDAEKHLAARAASSEEGMAKIASRGRALGNLRSGGASLAGMAISAGASYLGGELEQDSSRSARNVGRGLDIGGQAAGLGLTIAGAAGATALGAAIAIPATAYAGWELGSTINKEVIGEEGNEFLGNKMGGAWSWAAGQGSSRQKGKESAALDKLNRKLGTSYGSFEEMNRATTEKNMAKKAMQQNAQDKQSREAWEFASIQKVKQMVMADAGLTAGAGEQRIKQLNDEMMGGRKGEENWRLKGASGQFSKGAVEAQAELEKLVQKRNATKDQQQLADIQHRIDMKVMEKQISLIQSPAGISLINKEKDVGPKPGDAIIAKVAAQQAVKQGRSSEEVLAAIRRHKIEEEYLTFNKPVNVAQKLAHNPYAEKLAGMYKGDTASGRDAMLAAGNNLRPDRLEGQGPSDRLEGHVTSGRLEGSGPRSLLRRAGGGAIESGSFVVKASQAGGAAGIPGVGYVTGGTPGKDSVMFDVLAGGGSPSGTQALLMPGEAIVPPSFAGIGQAINDGIMSFSDGGLAAARDIATTSPRGVGAGIGGGGGSGVTHTFELSEDVKSFLRLPSGTQLNGTTP